MQSFGNLTPIEKYVEALLKGYRRATHIFQPKYDKDPNHMRESTEEHLHHFSNQIVIVEEIKMAHINDGLIPRKLNQWLKKAKDLKRQVSVALKEQQKSKDPSLQYQELKHMCDEIFDNMKDCPIEDGNDKPMAFIARMHNTEDHNSPADSDLLANENGLQALDVDTGVTSSVKGGKHSISIGSKKGAVSFLESYGDPILKFGSKFRLTIKGESSRSLLEISPVNSSSHVQEGDQTDDIGFARVGESELGMIFPILLVGNVSDCLDLRLQVLSMPSSQETFDLNNDFGLRQEMDNYLFSAMKKYAELEGNSHQNANCISLPLIVYRRSKEMPTDEEWNQANVVNLIEKNVRLLNEEPHCPNLMILFLQRNSRLTEIPSSFFNQMPALRFLDLSDTRIKALPSSLFELKNLRMLLLRSCACLDSLPAEVKHLISMEVLDLLGTDLSDLPKEIGELTQLRHLQLSFYQPDKNPTFQSELVSSGAILQLQALQGLSVVVHPKDRHWKRIVRGIIKQVGELKMLSYLQFYFPSVEALMYFIEVSHSWKEKKLRRFNFIVGHYIKRIISRVPDEVESKYEENDKCLRFVNGGEVSEVMKGVLKSVTAFYLDHHLEIKSLSEFEISNFEELKFCVVRECPNIQVMVMGEREKRNVSFFPNLEYLGLHYLWKMEKIWEDPVPPGSFQALKYLMIGTCGELEYIASHSMLQCLNNLEKFIIEDCESLTSIVKEKEMVKNDDAPLLPRLKKLVLRHLPQLVALGRGLFPSEEIISIHFCPKLILRPGPNRVEWKKLLSLPYMTALT